MIAYDELWRWTVMVVLDGLWVVDLRGRTLFNNKRMAEMLGDETESISGRSCFEYVFPEDMPEAERRFAECIAGRSGPVGFRLRRSDGSVIWVSIDYSPVCDASGATVGLLGLFSDITGFVEAS